MADETLRADGDQVRNRRWDRGWTQEGLAKIVGCSKRTIENVEKGKPISVTTLRAVAKALGVTPEALRLHDRPPPTEVSKDTVEVPETQPPQGVPGEPERTDRAGHNGKVAVDTDVRPLELVIDVDFDSFTAQEQERVLHLIKETLQLGGDIRVLSKRRGSVILTLELTAADAERLHWAVQGGQLAALGVVEARKLSEAATTREFGRSDADTTSLAETCSAAPTKCPDVRGTGGRTLFQLLVVRGQQRGSCLAFPPGEFVIGRGTECQVRSSSLWISRRHCLLRVTPEAAHVRDLGSMNGTLVNGSRVTGERRLSHGDQLQVGLLEFEVRLEGAIAGSRTVTPRLVTAAEARAPETLALMGLETSSELPPILPRQPARQGEETEEPGAGRCDESRATGVRNKES
jgi:transcriptional regulator with XRE-family HTH domain